MGKKSQKDSDVGPKCLLHVHSKATIEIDIGNKTYSPTKANTIIDTSRVTYGKTRRTPRSFNSLTAEAEPRIYNAMNPAPESKNSWPSFALIMASKLRLTAEPVKRIIKARAGALRLFSTEREMGILLSLAKA